jgi:hypothetical protein
VAEIYLLVLTRWNIFRSYTELNKYPLYISFVNTSYSIITRGYASRENIAFGVHSVKYISILHAKQTNILYLFHWYFSINRRKACNKVYASMISTRTTKSLKETSRNCDNLLALKLEETCITISYLEQWDIKILNKKCNRSIYIDILIFKLIQSSKESFYCYYASSWTVYVKCISMLCQEMRYLKKYVLHFKTVLHNEYQYFLTTHSDV